MQQQISTVLRHNKDNHRLVKIVVALTSHVVDYQTDTAKVRSTTAAHEWYLHQVTGGYIDHIDKIWQEMEKSMSLERCGFLILFFQTPLFQRGKRFERTTLLM